jgi:aminoglycoside 3-N-acetyltransferase
VSWATSAELADGLRAAGLPAGGVVMVHARLSAFPWIVGGTEAVVRALLSAVGPLGTLVAYASWEDHPFHLANWPADRQDAYRRGMPPFDPVVSEARRSHGRLPERLRTWPGAYRSAHPEGGVVAVGARAAWLTTGELDDDPYDETSPFARVIEAGGTVLLLGAPLSALTLVHHVERIVAVEPKRWATYELPVRQDGKTVWRWFRTIDTSVGAYDFGHVTGDVSYIEVIGRSALDAGVGRSASVLGATCHLFPARGLAEHARNWMERELGVGGPGGGGSP